MARDAKDWFERLTHICHRHILLLLAGSYVAAAVWPAAGVHLRGLTLAQIGGSQSVEFSFPMALLTLLLFNSGLGVPGKQLLDSMRRPGVLLAGLAANALLPLVFLGLVGLGLCTWHNHDETQTLLAGLAVVAVMPVAGSSTGWAQNANGDSALSLSLVLASTFLSPLVTPAALNSLSGFAQAPYSEGMTRLAGRDAPAFLTVSIVLPSVLGVLAGMVLSKQCRQQLRPFMRLANTIAILVLCYTNASTCLPQILHDPDWDFLAITLAIVLVLCALGFGTGFVIARLLGAGAGQRASLMFGLGMNNNGTGLVLAAEAFKSQPMVLLPILAFNLVQHLLAGCVFTLLQQGVSVDFLHGEHARSTS
jgi:bile acid:Na+ symporter, BASS family